MTLYVRNSGVWVTPKQMYHNNAGVWQQIQKVYLRDAGNWKLQYANVVISANTSNYNLYTALGSPTDPLTVYATINAGVEVTATTNANYAFTVGTFPAGSKIYLVNNGYIVGRGGQGIGKTDANGGQTTAPASASGGPALNANFAISIDNTNGVVGGGGGAGGVGGGKSADCSCSSCGGIRVIGFDVSGGGAGYGSSGLGGTEYESNSGRYGNSFKAFGSFSTNTIGTGSKTWTSGYGMAGGGLGRVVRVYADSSNWCEGPITSTSGGTSWTINVTSTSGSGTYSRWWAYVYSVAGGVSTAGAAAVLSGTAGASGTLGVAGSSGTGSVLCGFSPSGPGTAGAAGACTQGNSNITWIATGNRYGALN